MDMIILVAAFVAFFALVVAWIAAPTSGKPAVAAEPGPLTMGEARA
jgi:hypothetical protein